MKDLEKYRILKQAGLLTESEALGYDLDEKQDLKRGSKLLREYSEDDVPSRQEIEDAVLEVFWIHGEVKLIDVVDFLKMVGWPESAIQAGLDRIG